MRHITLLMLVIGAVATKAQTCIYSENPMPGGQSFNINSGFVRSDGGTLTTAMPDFTSGPYITRWGNDGQVLWNNHFTHMSPPNLMLEEHMTNSSNGGALLSGEFFPNMAQYTNIFGAEVDANGDPQWVRIYMLDSVPQMGNQPGPLMELNGGGYLFPINTNKGISISRLDDAAIPIWTKRYEPGAGLTGGTVFVEPDQSITLIGYKGNKAFIARLDQDGVVQWKRTYPSLGGFAYSGGSPTRTMNGDYVFVEVVWPFTYVYVTRMDNQGNILWRRSFADPDESGSANGVNELANGHLLILAYNLIETDADGVFINQWHNTNNTIGPGGSFFIKGEQPHGDTLMIGSTHYGFNDAWPTLLVSSGPASLGCAFDPPTAGTSTLTANPSEITDDTLSVVRDSLKTWTMNFAPAVDPVALDPACFIVAGQAKPGFMHSAYGVITNHSLSTTGPITATLTFSPVISYVSATPAPSSTIGQIITWQLPALGPNSQRLVHAEFQVPPDPGLIGTYIPYTFTFSQDSTETSFANNTATVAPIFWGSYDPNAKDVLPRDFYHLEMDSILDYTIHFQNTGNAAAATVVIRDTLPLDVDVSTFRMGAMSHPCTYSLTGNGILTFTFANINLPDSTANEPASHGLVNFRIKPILPLFMGQQITNAADIYFDFNPPIHTSDATVIVEGSTGLADAAHMERLTLYPVPAKEQINAILPAHFMVKRATITGVDGRTMPARVPGTQDDRITLSTQQLATGAYVLTVYAADGRRLAARFTKE